ncbi:MAG: zinc ribbon domain-containing protein [Chloroflexota bacterium]
MAIYEYVCPRCGKEFEVMRPISESSKPAACPKCGARAERLVSAFSSKTGFYVRVPEKPPFRKKQGRAARKR